MTNFSQKTLKICLKLLNQSIYSLVILALIWQCFPRVTSFAQTIGAEAETQISESLAENAVNDLLSQLGEPKRIITVPITAYSSTVDQCDSTPCITANGFNLCENNAQNVIAANFLPFGTKVRFPDYDPDTIYTVQDRMNARYYYRADIWMKTRNEAKIFGIKKLTMEIY